MNLAGGGKTECKVTDPVHIQWKDRFAVVNAVVLPGGKPLLGSIPLDFMDLIVAPQPSHESGEGSPLDPVNRELVGVHGDHDELMAL